MLSEATSGLKVAAGRTRSSAVMVGAPPVVMFTTTPERCLITLRNGANASGDWSGRPSCGLRACRCTMAAPASAAPIAASAISCGGHRQMRRHRRRMDRAGDGTGDDDFARLAMSVSFPVKVWLLIWRMDVGGDPRVSAGRKSPRPGTSAVDDTDKAAARRSNSDRDDLRHRRGARLGGRLRCRETWHRDRLLARRSRVPPLLLVGAGADAARIAATASRDLGGIGWGRGLVLAMLSGPPQAMIGLYRLHPGAARSWHDDPARLRRARRPDPRQP